VNVGDLVEFKCIGAGKIDNPPYSKDGEWRTGVVLEKRKMNLDVVDILYRGHVFVALVDNCRLIGNV
jgi:hypothetical protein